MTGAYSTGSYDSHPYMLLNYTDTLDDVFTLIHELGHSMHTYYSNAAQPPIYADYSLFCAEVASTTNEMLLYHYLLDHAESKEQKALLLSKHLDDIRSILLPPDHVRGLREPDPPSGGERGAPAALYPLRHP